MSTSCRDDQRRVYELAVQLLRLEEIVRALASPFGDGGQVFGLLLVG